MPANYTPNYQLNQWERSDKVLMDDFNHDNARIEQSALDALSQTVSAQGATLANHTSTIAGLGNCMIVCRTYSGTGGTCMHDFDHRVLAIFAFGTYSHFSAIRGSSHGAGWADLLRRRRAVVRKKRVLVRDLDGCRPVQRERQALFPDCLAGRL